MSRTALHKAAGGGKAKACRALLKAGVNVNALVRDGANLTPLHKAVKKGSEACVSVLLAAGA